MPFLVRILAAVRLDERPTDVLQSAVGIGRTANEEFLEEHLRVPIGGVRELGPKGPQGRAEGFVHGCVPSLTNFPQLYRFGCLLQRRIIPQFFAGSRKRTKEKPGGVKRPSA
jgi:hypothetical protein